MMRYDDWTSLPEMLFDSAAQLGERPLFWDKRSGEWTALSGGQMADQVAALASALREMGIGKGDRVVLVSESRKEWGVADLGIMAAGAIAVPAYITNQVSDHVHILTDSGAKGAIVSTAQLAKNLLPACEKAPNLNFVISMEDLGRQQASAFDIHDWQETLESHSGKADAVRGWLQDAARTDTACLIYTSGTGGVPKGVMLSHGAILCNCKGAHQLLETLGLDDEVFLSFLPLSHSYEHTAGLMFPISIGAQVYFAEGVDKLGPNMEEVKPTIMTAVPRLYETMHGRIMRGVQQQGGSKEKLFLKAVDLGRKRFLDPGSLTLWDKMSNKMLDKLVRSKVQARFGGRLKALVSGGGPLNVDIGLFFTGLGLRLLQGYGLTESAPVVSCNIPSKIKMETVGPAFVDTEVRIADDGEILIRGELVMQGYWNQPDATAEAIQDGWLHTGDIGEIDDDGYIKITDRKKDIIVNSGGDNIAPQRIEGFLTLQPEIAQAMVHGDKRPHLVGLIVPDPDFARDWAKAAGKDGNLSSLVEDPDFRAAISDAVDRVNGDLSVIERVRRFKLIPDAFTIENEMMTPSLKIRRHIIRDTHGDALNALYGG